MHHCFWTSHCCSKTLSAVWYSGLLKWFSKKMTWSTYIKELLKIMGFSKLSLLIRIKTTGRKATLIESLLWAEQFSCIIPFSPHITLEGYKLKKAILPKCAGKATLWEMILNLVLWNPCPVHYCPLPCVKLQTHRQKFQGHHARRHEPAYEFSTIVQSQLLSIGLFLCARYGVKCSTSSMSLNLLNQSMK